MNQSVCLQQYPEVNSSWCHPVFDNWYCWPPTAPGEKVFKACPKLEGMQINNTGYRYCREDGTWESFRAKSNNSGGSTNYNDCILVQLRELHEMCDKFGEKVCQEIAANLRILEMVGLSLSIVSLIISLVIFFHYRVLRNNRTKIHINLYIASLLYMMVRMVKYLDQLWEQRNQLLENAEYFREALVSLLEYSRTAMFMWMFIEGLYLHNMITVSVFQAYSHIKLFLYIGWSLPLLITFIWLITMLTVERVGTTMISWKYYYFLPYYWILEGPRSTIIVINLLFLLNIIRVLIVKLRETQTSEIEQVRKAVRAAIFLLPLLGICNMLFFLDYRFDVSWKFAMWSYTSYFLISFQGFFIAIFYCFLNGEVQTAVKNSFYLHMSLRKQDYISCRTLTVISAVTEEEKVASRNFKPNWIQKCCKKTDSSPEENELDSSRNGRPRISTEETIELNFMEDRTPETKV